MEVFKLLPRKHFKSFLVLLIIQSLVLSSEVAGLYYALSDLLLVVRQIGTTGLIDGSIFSRLIVLSLLIVVASLMRLIGTLSVIHYIENERQKLMVFFFGNTLRSIDNITRETPDYELTKRTISEADQLVNIFMRSLSDLASGIIAIVVCTGLFFYAGGLTLVFCVGMVFFIVVLINRATKPKINRLSEQLVKSNSERFKFVLEGYQNIKAIQAGNYEQRIEEYLNSASKDFKRANFWSQAAAQGLLNMIEILLLVVALVVSVFVFVLYDQDAIRELYNGLSGVETVSLLVVLLRLRPAISKLHVGMSRTHFAKKVIDDLSNTLKTQKSKTYDKIVSGLQVNEIQVKKVYVPTTNRSVGFKNSWKAGHIYVLHGPSGAGKTTFIDALLGLTETSESEILLNNEHTVSSLAEIQPKPYFYCTQSPYVLSDSLRNNLMPSGGTDESAIGAIIELLGLCHLDTGLPLNVGLLSGGERQRINIGRCLLSGKSIFVFDETFSSIDSEQVGKILSFISNVQNNMALIISHDIALIENQNFTSVTFPR